MVFVSDENELPGSNESKTRALYRAVLNGGKNIPVYEERDILIVSSIHLRYTLAGKQRCQHLILSSVCHAAVGLPRSKLKHLQKRWDMWLTRAYSPFTIIKLVRLSSILYAVLCGLRDDCTDQLISKQHSTFLHLDSKHVVLSLLVIISLHHFLVISGLISLQGDWIFYLWFFEKEKIYHAPSGQLRLREHHF